MKTIGLIGGMSWESTQSYYRIINEYVKSKLGGFHSASCILVSLDFSEIEKNMSSGNWEECGRIISEAAKKLENAGADFIIICTNTMHKVIDIIEDSVSIPIFHIADATAEAINKNDIKKVALLGTRPTMKENFYIKRLERHGIEVLVPSEKEMNLVNNIIFDELCLGEINMYSRVKILGVIEGLIAKGAQGAILGCTELGLLVKDQDLKIPVFDTAVIHGEKAAERSII